MKREGGFFERLSNAADIGRAHNPSVDTGMYPGGILEDFPADSEVQLSGEIWDK